MKHYLLGLACIGLSQIALGAETTIGQAYQKSGLEIGAVYLQPVSMSPDMQGTMQGNPDAHLELDVHALKNNPYGFPEDAWIPYLQVSYHLEKLDKAHNVLSSQTGWLMPMEANDGPHYGRNIKFDGPGNYKVTYHIDPPSWNGFFRHTDKETGIAPWFNPIDVSWDFVYLGTGKKGGY